MTTQRSSQKAILKAALCSFGVLVGVSCHAALIPLYTPAPEPPTSKAFSSTREVRSLLWSDSVLWAATAGGVLRRDAEKKWQKFTTSDGLPTNETRGFRVDKNGSIIAQTPRGEARFDGAKWVALPLAQATKKEVKNVTAQAQWREVSLEATLSGLRLKKLQPEVQEVALKSENSEPQVEILALPNGVGSHISALLPRENDVCVALFGDGLWLTDGKKWQAAPASLQVPPQATEITALAGDKNPEWVGTRRDGIWHHANGAWQQELQGEEPFNHNAQAIQEFKGALFVSTLEDGLIARAGDGWQRVGTDFLSSNAPRQMCIFQDALFVRHGGGAIDRCDGFSWQKNLFPSVPRRKVLALATDNQRLYLGQWGGWSEWDGKNFTHHLNIPELQGLPPMALLPDGEKLWFATQSRGLAEVERESGNVRWHDERSGLSDDWITCLLKTRDELFAGTFVGGLMRWDGEKWQAISETKGENITALCEDGSGGIYIATRHGIWQRSAEGQMKNLQAQAPWIEPEVQSLWPTADSLWIGSRTGLFFWKPT